MIKKVSKILLFSLLTLSSFSLMSCNISQITGKNKITMIDYKIDIKDGDGIKKNFISFAGQTLQAGKVDKNSSTHLIEFETSDALNIDNLKIYCNDEQVNFNCIGERNNQVLYPSYRITSDKVNIQDKKELNYLIDLTNCSINYVELNALFSHKETDDNLKYSFDFKTEENTNISNNHMSLDLSNLNIFDVNKDNKIKIPSDVIFYLFVPESWNCPELTIKNDKYDVYQPFFSCNPYKNEERYKVTIDNKIYDVFISNQLINDGDIRLDKENTYNVFVTPNKYEENTFNIMTLRNSLEVQFEMYLEKEVFDSIYSDVLEPNKNEILTFNENGISKNLRKYHLLNSSWDFNGISTLFNPIKIKNSSSDLNDKLYDAYFAYKLDEGTLTSENYKDIHFELYDSSFKESKITIPSSAIQLQTRTNELGFLEKFLLFKITPEMLDPFKEEFYPFSTSIVPKTSFSGCLYLIPKFDNKDKFVEVNTSFSLENYKLAKGNNVAALKSFSFRDINSDIYDSYIPLISLNDDNKLAFYINKEVLDNINLIFEVQPNSEYSILSGYKIDYLEIEYGNKEKYKEQLEFDSPRSKFGFPLKDCLISSNKAKFNLKVFALTSSPFKIDFSDLVNHPIYDIYLSKEPGNFDKYTKLTSTNVNDYNLEFILGDPNPKNRLYYYIKPKSDSSTPFCQLSCTYIYKEHNGDDVIEIEENILYSNLLLDIYSNCISFDRCPIYYFNSIDSIYLNYVKDLVIKVEIIDY